MNWRIRTAWHEAGHALMAYECGSPVHCAYVARSRREATESGYLGRCRYSPLSEADTARITIAGLVGEALWFSRRYAGDDDAAEESGDVTDCFYLSDDYRHLEALGLEGDDIEELYNDVLGTLRPLVGTLAALARRMVRQSYVWDKDLMELRPVAI